jgi:type II secretory pathway pseudopilin PulG
MRSIEKFQKGYTAIEVALVMGLVLILISLSTTNLLKFQHTTQVSSTINSFIADYKEQQIKAMVGDTEGGGTTANYGVHFETTSYTLFRNSYGTANFTINLPGDLQFSTTFPSSQIIFSKGSGSISGFISGDNTITLRNTADNSQKTITINQYGVVTGVN